MKIQKIVPLVCLLTSLTAFGQTNPVPWKRDFSRFITNCETAPIIHQTKVSWDDANNGVRLTWPPVPTEVNMVYLLRWHESPGPKGMIFDGFVPLYRDTTTFVDTAANKNKSYLYGLKTETACGTSYNDDVPYNFSKEKHEYHHFNTNIIVMRPLQRGPIPIPPRSQRMNQQTNK